MSGLGLVLLLVIVTGSMAGFVRQMLPPVTVRFEPGMSEAIVVLGGGRRPAASAASVAAQVQSWQLTTSSLERARKAWQLHQDLGLPVVFSGGSTGKSSEGASEAVLMAQQGGVAADFVSESVRTGQSILEEQSTNTWENALYTADLLEQMQIRQVILVTSEEHLARASLCFRKQGIVVEPIASRRLPAHHWLPSTETLSKLPSIFYEWTALFWYQFRYF